MRKLALSAALAAVLAAAVSAAATRALVAADARSEQEHAIRRIQADHAGLRLELDALRRELMRRPVAPVPAPAPVVPDPDRIPAQTLPTAPKE